MGVEPSNFQDKTQGKPFRTLILNKLATGVSEGGSSVMGLDSVELVMAYEEAFGIELPEAEAAHIRTPADVISLIEQKLGPVTTPRCLSQAGFYRIRKALCAELGTHRKQLRPNTSLSELFFKKRLEMWRAVHARSGLRDWPQLECPRWLWILSFIIGPVIYGIWLVSLGYLPAGIIVKFALSVPVGAFAMSILTQPWHTTLPLQTLGDLAKYVATFNAAALAGAESMARTEIARIVREITIQQLGLKSEIYRENAEFIRDFGMD